MAEPGGPLIELRGASVAFDRALALHPLDLAVPRGTCTVLLGPSGCGKSTTLRLILGLIHPTAGEVLAFGAPLPDPVEPVRRRMGYLVQGGALFAHLRAGDNAALVARWLGWPEDRVAARLAELAGLCRVERAWLERFPAQLSGGQRQRVALMRALMLSPEVLLLDEPFGALDPITRRRLQDDLRGLFADLGTTVILVTHDLGEASFFADRVVLLREGRVVQSGPPEDLLLRPADPFVAEFVDAQRPPWEAR